MCRLTYIWKEHRVFCKTGVYPGPAEQDLTVQVGQGHLVIANLKPRHVTLRPREAEGDGMDTRSRSYFPPRAAQNNIHHRHWGLSYLTTYDQGVFTKIIDSSCKEAGGHPSPSYVYLTCLHFSVPLVFGISDRGLE